MSKPQTRAEAVDALKNAKIELEELLEWADGPEFEQASKDWNTLDDCITELEATDAANKG